MGLSQDATTVVALAGTALAFAGSAEEEAERWLSTLRLYGEAGVMLQALGVGDAPRRPGAGRVEADGADGKDPVAAVLTCAGQFAARRGARTIGTLELLLAVMQVYGEAFDRALERRGTDRVELWERWSNARLRRGEKAGGAPAAAG